MGANFKDCAAASTTRSVMTESRVKETRVVNAKFAN
jgi:hypothetical protein